MTKLIVKYIIIHVAAILIANLIGIIVYSVPDFFGYDIFSNVVLLVYGQQILNYMIRVIIAYIVFRDMQRINNKVNYWILILIIMRDFYGTAFFLLSVFFQDYKSINTLKNAK